MYNYISVNNIITRVKITFNVNIDTIRWDIVELIGYAIEKIRFGVGYIDTFKNLEINSYRTKPFGSNVLFIHGVLNQNGFLKNTKEPNRQRDIDLVSMEKVRNDLIGAIKSQKCCIEDDISDECLETDNCGNLVLQPYQQIVDIDKTVNNYLHKVNYHNSKLTQNNDFWWYQEGNVIKTNIESGNCLLYYKSIMVDDEGLPMIYNSPNYIEYIVWSVMHGLLLRGEKHPVLTLRETESERIKYMGKAKNEIIIDEFDSESFINAWTTFKAK